MKSFCENMQSTSSKQIKLFDVGNTNICMKSVTNGYIDVKRREMTQKKT